MTAGSETADTSGAAVLIRTPTAWPHALGIVRPVVHTACATMLTAACNHADDPVEAAAAVVEYARTAGRRVLGGDADRETAVHVGKLWTAAHASALWVRADLARRFPFEEDLVRALDRVILYVWLPHPTTTGFRTAFFDRIDNSPLRLHRLVAGGWLPELLAETPHAPALRVMTAYGRNACPAGVHGRLVAAVYTHALRADAGHGLIRAVRRLVPAAGGPPLLRPWER